MPAQRISSMDEEGLRLAFEEAKKSYSEGGIPIGSVLLRPNASKPNGIEVLGSGHNERIQKSSATLHGEISALEDAGRLKPEVYRNSTIYTTLSPCSMCTGAILLYKIPRVVIGENKNFLGGEDLLRDRGVEVIVIGDKDCQELMARFIEEKPEEWNEDIGGE
ncbi:cytidine deaminase-like protein [Crucibulum laeve]|uniref:Cytosine deaminase n=1 Tax=Crucibulum laeve TaxID=68775 RepID=A0A5C3LKW2_9AGAR|nr:cytidine deaminase-like protein [Crucibulum laeve]